MPNFLESIHCIADEDLSYEDESQSQTRCSVILDFMKDTEIHAPYKDKLAGYPHWVQGNEECPACPTCGRTMNQLIAQLESDDNVPVLWGDVGSGYLVQCLEHKDQVAFFW
jgi:uncharacterized protein YwqG